MINMMNHQNQRDLRIGKIRGIETTMVQDDPANQNYCVALVMDFEKLKYSLNLIKYVHLSAITPTPTVSICLQCF